MKHETTGTRAAGHARVIALGLAATAVLAGCVGPRGRRWDFDLPTTKRVAKAALDAALTPSVIAPALGAAVFQADGWDRKVSSWAHDRTPLYGSVQSARDWSDRLLYVSLGASGALAVATPTGPDFTYDVRLKAMELGLGGAALGTAVGATEALKLTVDRQRPYSHSTTSFPSGHASAAAVSTALSHYYIDHLPLPELAKWPIHGAYAALPYAVGWARVEGGNHFPSDTLAGIALGNFFGNFVNELLEVDPDDSLRLSLTPWTDGVYVGVSMRW
ncbi:MAG: phosphatase PAP2 family protein [Myxococcales bacterium]|nr:phosphatase PAP2 family protein [Myxococcales bacterium]